MPARYEIDPEGRFVTAFYEGAVVRADFHGMFRAYVSDPRFDLARPHLVDIGAMTGAEHGFAEMMADIRMLEGPYRQAGMVLRIAVFGGGDMAYGMARMFLGISASSDVIEARHFEDRAGAVAWLTAPVSRDP